MNHATSPCSDERLQSLLHGEEHGPEFRSAAGHLESCTRCQARITELAADDDTWSEAVQFLVLDKTDSEIEQEQASRSWHSSSHRTAANAWTDSIASQLLSPPSHPEMLGRLGRYEIERLIGSGGMGVVFKGFDSELNRPVAVKVLAPHLSDSGSARQRFAREARAAAAIVHEHVVAIHNVESDSEPPFLVMQYVPGRSLQGRLDQDGPLSMCEVLRIARQTAAGLAAAHEQGLVHRDVKPSNILLEQGVERALLSDFGLARASDDASLTHSGHALGTPHYMSPEQARGETVDQRSDLFSLGSVMYAMCTGRPPFRAETSFGVLRRITDSEPRSLREVNAEVPLWLCCLIEKLHAKLPDDRFASAAEVSELLGQCLAHLQQPEVHALPESVTALCRDIRKTMRLRGVLRQQPRTAIACVATSIVLLAGAAWIATRESNDARLKFESDFNLSEQREPSETSASLSDDSDLATDWDAADQQIQQVTSQVGEFTSRADRLWDDMPFSSSVQSESDGTSSREPSE